MSAVYFIQAGEGPVKIGWAKSPEKRLAYMQCFNHAALKIIRAVPAPRIAETMAHRTFRDRHIRGEWFAFDPSMTAWSPDAGDRAQTDGASPPRIAPTELAMKSTRYQVPVAEFEWVCGVIRGLSSGQNTRLEARDLSVNNLETMIRCIRKEFGRGLLVADVGGAIRVWRQ